jgi:hypothetical protein
MHLVGKQKVGMKICKGDACSGYPFSGRGSDWLWLMKPRARLPLLQYHVGSTFPSLVLLIKIS